MVIYGINSVLEALRTGRVRRVRVSGRTDRRIDEALALARERGVPVERVEAQVLAHAARGGVHQGIVAEIEALRDYSVAGAGRRGGARRAAASSCSTASKIRTTSARCCATVDAAGAPRRRSGRRGTPRRSTAWR